MPYPKNVPIVDTMLDLPFEEAQPLAQRFPNLRDAESRGDAFEHPAGYMFKKTPEGRKDVADPIGSTLAQMDRWNIETAVISVRHVEDETARTALTEHKARFAGVLSIDPNQGMDAIRQISRAHQELGIVGVSVFPVGYHPPVPLNDKRMYPIYVKCIELDIALFSTVGVPGPRLPFESQYVGLVDEVCWFYPELRFVMRHGAEPWADLAAKLLLKWPNLYYSTSAFAPRYYPQDIIDFANKRGADKFIYAGYYPSGLTLERIFTEMEDVPLRDHVWPKFLRENAVRVLKLDER